ncbi:caprin-2 [Octopus bimaculoides]|uniref:C1q domain-containing protein n=1 Tax=Octopus bimaculoides TaxID=37653 RepID=A0A0L8GUT2_OCTBM|nr:caprin-2 [Octopus bimaculoides]|eukprot:XP_014778103.1 PREDICTED: caprin-2-like [Octopus bimaculoides]
MSLTTILLTALLGTWQTRSATSLGAKDISKIIHGVDFRDSTKPFLKKLPFLPMRVQLNCSCAREIEEIRDQLKYEVSQRIEMLGTIELFISEIFNLKTLVNSKVVPPPVEPKTIQATAAADFEETAFSSRLSHHLTNLKPDQIVIFDQLLTNIGSAYDHTTGIFNCPISGTYQFFVKILSGFNDKVETALIVNTIEVTRLYSGAQHAHGSSTAPVIILLEKGDKVFVKALYQKSSHVHGVYSTFSGYLLRPI